jgi:hypothetical protein
MIAKISKAFIVALFFLGFIVTGVLGTETRLLFYWPAVLLFGLAAVLMLTAGGWKMRSVPADWCLAAALIFGLYIALRAFTSPVMVYAREDLFLLLGCAVAYTLSATALSQPRLRMVLLSCLILITIGNLAVGFIHFSGKWTFHIVPSYMRSFGEGQRIGGFFNNPNHLAAFLTAMSLLFASITLFGRASTANKLLLGFLSLASAIGIALTVSRGALIGLVAGGVVLAILSALILWQTYPHLIGKVLAGVAVLALLGGLVLYGVFSEQLNARFGGAAFDRGDPRPQIWAAAQAMSAAQPWVGAGARMFYEGCITYRTAESPSWMQDALFVHNDWLQMRTEYGWCGLVLLIILLGAHFLNGWFYLRWFVGEHFPHTATLASRNLGFVVGALSAMTALLVHAAVDFHFHIPAVALTAAVLLGILANPGILLKHSNPLRLPGVRPLLKLAMPAAGLAMIYGAVLMGRADYYVEKADRQSETDDLGLAHIHWLSRALELDPLNANTWYERGLARFDSAAGQPAKLARPMLERATSDLEQARLLNPYSVYIALAVAEAHAAAGQSDLALQEITQAYPLAPLYEAPRLALALQLHRRKDWPQAEEAYLWASQAAAECTNNWFPLYQQMLQDALK